MSTLSAFFVRKVTDDAISAVRVMFPRSEIRVTSEFMGVILDQKANIPEQTLIELSSYLKTDVMWLSYQSVVDGFEYYHWRTGILLRALVYGCVMERTWERIEGEPEDWERAAFFDPEVLSFILEDEESDEEKHRLEQFWQAGELKIGRMEPYLSGQNCAFHVAIYYRFPGWANEPFKIVQKSSSPDS